MSLCRCKYQFLKKEFSKDVLSRRASFNFELVFLSAIWLTNALNIAPPMLITEFYEVATEGGRKAL